jgi:hypothetical protein
MRDLIKRLLNEIKYTKDPELLKKQYGYRPAQTTKGSDSDIFKERDIDVFFSDKYKYHVHVDKFDNHLYLVAFFPHLDSSFFTKQDRLNKKGSEYHDKYSYQTKENIFYDIMGLMLDKCNTILKNDSLASFSYMGAPDIIRDKEKDLTDTKRFRIYNKMMSDQFKDTHILDSKENYSISVLINKKYIQEITKGLTEEESKKRYEEYKNWCLNTTLSGA